MIGLENQVVTTGADGHFHFDSVPVGDVKVVIDGKTANQPPAGFYFPEMVIDAQMLLGMNNWTMTNGPEVYLPRLSVNILQGVNTSTSNEIIATPDGAPNLSAFQRNQLSINVPANSLIGPNGQPLSFGQIGISTVPSDVVRDMLPPGVLQHTFDITVQAPGVATFSTPAPMSFPNVFNAAPGTKLNFLSFDHTTGRLVIEGTATVAADGGSVRTDPGTGVVHPGWHGLTPPGTQAGPSNGPPQCTINLGPSPVYASIHTPVGERTVSLANPGSLPKALPMIVGETGELSDPGLSWTAPTDKDVCGLKVEIGVDGPLAKFMQRTGNLQLKSQTFTLRPGTGKKKTLSGKAKTYDQVFGPGKVGNFLNDILYGAQIKVRTTLLKNQGPPDVQESTFYLFRWVNVTYPPEFQSGTGQTMAFRKTLNDGTGGYSMIKQVLTFLPASTETSVEISPRSGLPKMLHPDFSRDHHTLLIEFDPDRNGVFLQDMALKMKDGHDTLVGTLVGRAEGVPPIKIDLNALGYEAELKRVIESLRNISFPTVFGYSAPAYIFSPLASGIPPVVIRTNALVAGRSEYGDFLNLVPNGAKAVAPGKDGRTGTPDDVRFNRFVATSGRFETAFQGFMPDDRAIVGADGIAGSPDDKFSQQQAIDLGKRLDAEAIDLAQAVSAQFSDLNATADALQFVNGGGDVTLEWIDVFTDGGSGRDSGLGGKGVPVFGLGDFDAQQQVLKPLLIDPKLPLAAKFWALSDNLNRDVANRVKVAVAINIGWDSASSFAEYVADSVSHELGHTFGLLDAYTTDGKLGGTAACNAAGNCIPYDIMRNGQTSDPFLSFAPSNLQLLRASMGVGPGRLEEPLLDGLKAYRKTFNLADSNNGIREMAPADPAPIEPEIAVAQRNQVFFGELDEEPQNAATTAAGSSSEDIPLTVLNQGYGPLIVTSVSLVDGKTGFSVDPTSVVGTSIPPGGSLRLRLRFSSLTPGEAHDILVLQSNADGRPELQVPLLATAIAKAGTISVSLLGNNNLGGAALGDSAVSLTDIFRIANLGQQPLEIKDLHLLEGADSFRIIGLPPTLDTQPIVLTNGSQFTFGASFTPAQLGLTRGRIEIESNDPVHPKVQVGLVGTGLADAAPGHWGNNYVAMESPDFPNGQVLRARSDDQGNFEFFVPSDTLYHLAVFDPSTGLIGDETDTTAESGVRTFVAETLVFTASQEPDSDYDGLPDDIEFAIGTDPTKPDTDGDGLDDYTEAFQGGDPLSGRPSITGVIGQLKLPGQVRDVLVHEDPTGQRQLAYLAASEAGMTIVDVTDPTKPVLLSNLRLTADSVKLALDPNLQILAVSALEPSFIAGSIYLIDVSDRTSPRVRANIPFPATQIEVQDGYAYAGSDEKLIAINLQTGQVEQELKTPTSVLTHQGHFLYTFQRIVFQVIEVNGSDMRLRGSFQDGIEQMVTMFTDGTVVYGVSNNKGYLTADVSDPDKPVLISGSSVPPGTLTLGKDFALDAGGLGAMLAMDRADQNSNSGPALELLDASDPKQTYILLTRYPLPPAGTPYAVKLAAGTAFIAHGWEGLVMVNYRSVDPASGGPQLTLGRILPDPLIENAPFEVYPNIVQGTLIRKVELLVNGQLAQRGLSYPYALRATAPPLFKAGGSVTLQVRATDAAGNVGLSAPRVVPLVPDQPPTVQIQGLAGHDPRAGPIQLVEGNQFDVQVKVADDTRVQSVVLLINDAASATNGIPPFALVGAAPNIGSGPKTFIAQLRATDTAGLSTLSAPVTITLLPDTTPPVLLASDPADGGTGPRELDTIRLSFSEPLASASLNPANFDLLTPAGQLVRPSGFDLQNAGKEVGVRVTPLDPGDYQFIIHQKKITDRAGNPLGTSDLTIHFKVLTYSIKWNKMIFGQWAGGLWFDPTNWIPARIPKTNDWVLIDVPNTNIIVSMATTHLGQTGADSMQPVSIRNLISNQEVDLFYVNLHADNSIQVDNHLEIDASKLSNTRLVAGPHTVITRGEACCSNFGTAEGYFAAFDNLTMEGDFQMGTQGNAGPFNVVNRLEVHGRIFPRATFQFFDDATIAGPGTLTNCALYSSPLEYQVDRALGGLPHKVPITVILDTNLVVRGHINIGLEKSGVTLINRGQIVAEEPTDNPTLRYNSAISVVTPTVFNDPTIKATNTFLNEGLFEVRNSNRFSIQSAYLDAQFVNHGTVLVRSNSFLWIEGTTAAGKLVCDPGGICQLGGWLLNPGGATTELSGTGAWFAESGAQFFGGNVRMTDGAVLEGSPSFSNTTFEGDVHNYDWSSNSARPAQFPRYLQGYANTITILTNLTLKGRIFFHSTTNWPGALSLRAGSLTSDDTISLNGRGTIEFEGPNDANSIDTPSQLGGRILIGSGISIHGQSLTIGNNNVGLELAGTLLTQPGDKLRLYCAALTNSGVIHFSSDTVASGLAAFTQTADGRLEFDLAGTTPGTTHGQLVIGGTAALDGKLSISLVSPFQPATGARFQLIKFNHASGTFSTLQTPSLTPAGLNWSPQYNASDFSLRVVNGPP